MLLNKLLCGSQFPKNFFKSPSNFYKHFISNGGNFSEISYHLNGNFQTRFNSSLQINLRSYSGTSVIGCDKTNRSPSISSERRHTNCYSHIRTVKTAASNVSGNQGNITTLQLKKRPQRRKWSVDGEEPSKAGFWNVVACTTAEEYDLERLAAGLREQDLYDICPLETQGESTCSPDVVRARARYQTGKEPRELLFFREGSIVLWNCGELECDAVLQFTRPYESHAHDARLTLDESEAMKYTYTEPGKKSHLDVGAGTMVLSSTAEADLERYAFSNAMALSVKLGVWEASLDRYVDTNEFVTQDLRKGTRISMSRGDVLRKTGQLFALRHHINLGSDLLDTPDFYWDRDQLEALYLQTCSYFCIARRTKVMNEKLNHCVELVELLSAHLSDRHHVRLEWMIIVLIMVEVGFEILHFVHQ